MHIWCTRKMHNCVCRPEMQLQLLTKDGSLSAHLKCICACAWIAFVRARMKCTHNDDCAVYKLPPGKMRMQLKLGLNADLTGKNMWSFWMQIYRLLHVALFGVSRSQNWRQERRFIVCMFLTSYPSSAQAFSWDQRPLPSCRPAPWPALSCEPPPPGSCCGWPLSMRPAIVLIFKRTPA